MRDIVHRHSTDHRLVICICRISLPFRPQCRLQELKLKRASRSKPKQNPDNLTTKLTNKLGNLKFKGTNNEDTWFKFRDILLTRSHPLKPLFRQKECQDWFHDRDKKIRELLTVKHRTHYGLPTGP